MINEKLQIEDKKTNEAYENIKNALIQVVREIHCTRDQIKDQLPQLYDFTKCFSTIVSLNYDLLLYWILMYGNDSEINCDGHIFKDCFQSGGGFRDDWATLRTPIRNQKKVTLTFYQHGNLSIFRDVKNIESKLKSNINNNLLEVITDQWSDEKIPLFVAGGTGEKKEESIKTSPYLSTIYYEVLPSLISEKCNLVIYGWGMGQQESHLVNQIFKHEMKDKKGKVAISTYSKDQSECHRIYTEINKLAPQVEVEFFDSQSSGCWNNP